MKIHLKRKLKKLKKKHNPQLPGLYPQLKIQDTGSCGYEFFPPSSWASHLLCQFCKHGKLRIFFTALTFFSFNASKWRKVYMHASVYVQFWRYFKIFWIKTCTKKLVNRCTKSWDNMLILSNLWTLCDATRVKVCISEPNPNPKLCIPSEFPKIT